jgi:hypothetical protein
MSVRVISMVFESGPQDLGQHSVMMALADNADDKGVAWPGDELLARKSRLSVRQVIRVRGALEAEGWLMVKRKAYGPGMRGNLYQLNLAKLAARPDQDPVPASKMRSDTMSLGSKKTLVNIDACAVPSDTVSLVNPQVTPERSQVTLTPIPGDMTLADVVLNQGDPFHNRHRTVIEPSLTPQPPASGGRCVSIGSEKVSFEPGVVMGLEFLECNLERRETEARERASAAGAEVKLAAQIVWQTARVMRSCGWTQNATLEQAIGDALELFCSTEKCEPAAAADLAIDNVQAFIRDRGLLRHGWSWPNFFRGAYWRDSRSWPYERKALDEIAMQEKASIGVDRRSR